MCRLFLALPVVALLLSSCSWTSSTPKSDLQTASTAAKVAGEDDAAGRNSPIILMPSRPSTSRDAQAMSNKPKIIANDAMLAASSQPVVKPSVQSTTAARADVPAAAAITAASQPLAAGPLTSSATDTSAVDIETKIPANGTAIHLASYKEIGSAKRGWQVLSDSHKELVSLKPLYVSVDLPGKGHFLRLYGTGRDASSLKTICSEIQAEGAYCAANIAF